jgi:hypothetical protein
LNEQIGIKLQEADALLRELQHLRLCHKSQGGIANIFQRGRENDLARVRGLVDGFLFVLASTWDILLREVNEHYHLGLKEDDDIRTGDLITELRQRDKKAADVLEEQWKLHWKNASASNPELGWYVRLMKYRNAAAHRCVLQYWPEYRNTPNVPTQSTIYLMDNPYDQKSMPYKEQDLFEFLVSVREKMEPELGRLAANLGLTTSPAP